MVVRSHIFKFVLVLLIIAMPVAVFGAGVGKPSGGGSSIQWTLNVSGHDKVVLSISAPDGEVYTFDYPNGKAVNFNLKDLPSVEDGAYTWQLTAYPKVSPGLQKQLEAARKSGDEAAARKLMRSAGLGSPAQETGGFVVASGAIVSTDGTEAGQSAGLGGVTTNAVGENLPGTRSPSSSPARPGTPVTLDQVIPDDLIVQGSGCFGFDCVNNESFGFDTIRLKENNLRIKAEDTSVGSFPTNDWQLTFNDSASGGSSKFSVEDITGSKVPFTITAGAATNSIFADSTGRIGFRTSTPVLDLHVSTSNTPAIRLEQTSAGGFTAQTWDIAGNEANFFVRDVTSGSRLPFRIRPGAPTSSLDISADGDTGIGTGSPSASLHISRSDGTAKLLIDENSGTTAFRNMFEIENNGDIQLLLDRTDAGANDWQISNFSTSFQMSIPGSATPQFNLTNTGNLTIGGTLTELSTREAKQDFVGVQPLDVLRKVVDMPITTWAYKNDPAIRHIGPMAEDFYDTFNVGGSSKGITVTDRTGVAFAAIQGLHQELTSKQAEIDRLAKANAELETRLARIEALLQK